MAEKDPVTPPPTFAAVLELIETLRGEGGCPWDRKQTPASAVIYLLEEAFELAEAVDAEDIPAIREEMGDVLFQVLFLMSLYQQAGGFAPTDVLGENIGKMVHRHPHVFGTVKVDNAEHVKLRWRQIKQREKPDSGGSVLDAVPSGLPALMRAYRLSERAAGVGFDWDHLGGVMTQVEAEWNEFKAEMNTGEGDRADHEARLAEEYGDVLFTMVNVARLAGIHPETALSRATMKFVRRFKEMEAMAADRGLSLERMSGPERDMLWAEVKRLES